MEKRVDGEGFHKPAPTTWKLFKGYTYNIPSERQNSTASEYERQTDNEWQPHNRLTKI